MGEQGEPSVIIFTQNLTDSISGLLPSGEKGITGFQAETIKRKRLSAPLSSSRPQLLVELPTQSRSQTRTQHSGSCSVTDHSACGL